MALANQEPNSGNSLIKDLINDEESYGTPEPTIQDPAEEQIEEVKEKAETTQKPKQVETPKAEAKDQAPKKQEYRLKGKSDNKPQPAKTETPEEEEEESAAPSEPVMTAEFVREHGLPKNMVGLPYSELGRSYRNITSEYTRTRQKMAEMERGHTEKPVAEKREEAAPVPEEKSLDVLVQEHLSKLPDPLDDGFQSGLTKAITSIAVTIQNSVRKEYAKALADETGKLKPQIESAQEYAKRQAQKELSDEIQRNLPEGVNIQEVLKAFKEEYADDLIDLMPIYEKKPQRFVKDLVNFFNLNFELQDVEGMEEDATEELEERRLNALAQKKAAEALKESKKRKPSDFNSKDKKPNPKRTELMEGLLSDEEATFNQMNPQE
ncbi:MAG: hypothetical protein ACM3QX_18270 [Syntrophomonadaceae bacterium]